MSARTLRMRSAFGPDGFLVQEALLAPAELDELRSVTEEVAATVSARAGREGAGPQHELADGHRIQFSSHTAIQWEWRDGSEEIRLLEPVDHLHPRLAQLFADERLTAPVRAELGERVLAPFTSKMNLKRATDGSEFPWHQDYPYWYVAVGEDAQDVVTAIVFLDDAVDENGALRVLRGSHMDGPVPRDSADPTGFLSDTAALDPAREVVLEVPAGTVVWFGAFLVHRSSPNTSDRHRRALLPSWQPAGRPRLQEVPYLPERIVELP